MSRIVEVKGKVVFSDDEEVEFTLIGGLGWQQWGNVPDVLSRSVTLMDALMEAADGFLADHYGDDEEDEDEP